jgi:hypothetical protein
VSLKWEEVGKLSFNFNYELTEAARPCGSGRLKNTGEQGCQIWYKTGKMYQNGHKNTRCPKNIPKWQKYTI